MSEIRIIVKMIRDMDRPFGHPYGKGHRMTEEECANLIQNYANNCMSKLKAENSRIKRLRGQE